MSTIALTWNPAIGLPEAIALAALFSVAALWLAWPVSRGAGVRPWLLLLRALGVSALAVCWLNPGRWLDESSTTKRDWLVLLDRSASMKAGHDEKRTRWEVASGVAAELKKASGPRGDVHVRPFAAQIEDETAELSPNGEGTEIARALGSALDSNASLAGVVVVSDGRQTSRTKLDDVALRARGRGATVHVVQLGGEWGARDLSLIAIPRQVTTFKGQPAKIFAQLENRGLGNIRPSVVLRGADGVEIARKEAQLADGARTTVQFDLAKVPENGGDYTLHVEPWQGEHVPANNTDTVRVKVLGSKTRVLLLEGAPYWDSKFLAQLLRQQGAVDILTVHRLNEERYFRVEATGAEPLASPDTVFPDTAAALSRYDLIVFGKGADGFLNPARATALQGFVREQGGAVLFARGKPYSGKFPPLEPLEPLEWGEALAGGFRITPLADAGAGLFGSALPGADDRVWATLPPLEDVLGVARLKPFSRVLADGMADGKGARVPLLVVRRHGRGMTAVVNADGLWRWDFRPEVREQGALYQQFWVQLMQWCGSYSEFQPGQDFAVRLRDTLGEAGKPVRSTIAWRGAASQEPQPVLKITRDGKLMGEAVAFPLPGADGGREWAAIVTPPEPGRYKITVTDRAKPGVEQGEAVLTVPAPPGEADDLRPDPDTLAALARAGGGEVFQPADVEKLAAQLWKQDSTAARAKPRWEPLWPKWWIACLLAFVFGAEWWLRRREGLL